MKMENISQGWVNVMCLLKVLTLKKYFGFPRFAGVPDANSMSDGDQHRAGRGPGSPYSRCSASGRGGP